MQQVSFDMYFRKSWKYYDTGFQSLKFLTFCLSIAFKMPSISPMVTTCFRNMSFSASNQSVTCNIDLSKLARSVAVAGVACLCLVFCRKEPGTYGSDEESENLINYFKHQSYEIFHKFLNEFEGKMYKNSI